MKKIGYKLIPDQNLKNTMCPSGIKDSALLKDARLKDQFAFVMDKVERPMSSKLTFVAIYCNGKFLKLFSVDRR